MVAFRLCSNLVTNGVQTVKYHVSETYTTRGHQFKLFKEHSDVNVRKSFLVSAYGKVFHQRLLMLVHSVHLTGLLNLYTSLHCLHVFSFFPVFNFYTSNVVFFADVSADVRACVCAWTTVSAVAYIQPCCSSSFTACVYYC